MIKSKLTKDYWDANLYDRNHCFVSSYGNSLIELLDPQQGEKILDLGCGTGDLANELNNASVDVLGIDRSKNMIKKAQSKYPHINFQVGDATNLDYECEFDAVFSNATLHWIKRPKQVLSCIYKSLKPGARYVAEFGGKGNIETIANEIIRQLGNLGVEYDPDTFPWYYPSIAEYASLMESVGFRVTFARHYDRPTPLKGKDGLKNWIEMFGIHMLQGVNETKKKEIITKVKNSLKTVLYKENNWIADYKRIRIMGIKE